MKLLKEAPRSIQVAFWMMVLVGCLELVIGILYDISYFKMSYGFKEYSIEVHIFMNILGIIVKCLFPLMFITLTFWTTFTWVRWMWTIQILYFAVHMYIDKWFIYPPTEPPVNLLLVGVFLCLIPISIGSLFLPASNRWFKKRSAEMQKKSDDYWDSITK